MITLKEAFKIAQDYVGQGALLSKVADETDNFWVFDYDTDKVLIGPHPIAVDKKDGRVWGIFPPLLSDEQGRALEHAKKVEVPE